MRKIAQGAEATIWEDSGRIVKQRLPKKYRLPALDASLTKQRIRREARLLRKLRGSVRVPDVLEEAADSIVLEKIDGVPLKQCESPKLCEKAGESVGKMHSLEVVHGDLTTSNLFVERHGSAIVLLDFGLAYSSHKLEDFATDLHVFEELVSEECFEAFCRGYAKTQNRAEEVFARLGKLHGRGRYKKGV